MSLSMRSVGFGAASVVITAIAIPILIMAFAVMIPARGIVEIKRRASRLRHQTGSYDQ